MHLSPPIVAMLQTLVIKQNADPNADRPFDALDVFVSYLVHTNRIPRDKWISREDQDARALGIAFAASA